MFVALAIAPETPARYRPRTGRISFSRENVGPSVPPNHGGGWAPGGGAAPGGGGGGGSDSVVASAAGGS
nr:hypothetical protein GCM10020092_098450 [Actinoplanes digitatis]